MNRSDILKLWKEEVREHLYLDEVHPDKILVRMFGADQALSVFINYGSLTGWQEAGKAGMAPQVNRDLPEGFKRILLSKEFEETFGMSLYECWSATTGFLFEKFERHILELTPVQYTKVASGNTINLRLVIANKYGYDAAELFGKVLRLEMVY
jgi:hypothetical protein